MISLKDVTYSYGVGKPPVLENVSLEIPVGSFSSVIGPNGGGKSTLIKLILGLFKPQSGEILLFGREPEESRFRVGYAPQQARVDFHFPISVLDVVLVGRFGVPSSGSARFQFDKKNRDAALAALERMGIAQLSRKSFGDLSGGQRQRALIARALCGEPDLLVLDEPTNNMDPSSAERFYDLLEELNRTKSILIASHDLGVVSGLVDSVICVNREVRVHPTSELDGALIRDLYHSDVRLVRHDHRCSESGHLTHHCDHEEHCHCPESD